MKAYGYNTMGQFIGEVDCQQSPLEFGEWIVPGMATSVEPPIEKAGKIRVWNGAKWVYETPTETNIAE